METPVIEKKVVPVIEIEKGITIREDKVITTFSDEKFLKPFIDKIAKAVRVDAKSINTETDKGRKEIASRAHKVSKIKTVLMKVGKDSVIDLKAQVKAVTGGVNHIETALNNLRDETRAPLNLWEIEQDRIEKERVAGIKEKIAGIVELSTLGGDENIDQISGMIEAVDNIDCSEGYDEFAADAMKAVIEAKEKLSQAMQEIIAENQRQEAAKQKEADDKLLEEERKAVAIEARLNKLRSIPLDYLGKTAKEIWNKLEKIKVYEVLEEEFGIRYNNAISEQKTVIDRLTLMHSQALAVESIPIEPLKQSEPDPVLMETVEYMETESRRITGLDGIPTGNGVELTSIAHEQNGAQCDPEGVQSLSSVETIEITVATSDIETDKKTIIQYLYSTLGMYQDISEKLACLLIADRVPCVKYQGVEPK